MHHSRSSRGFARRFVISLCAALLIGTVRADSLDSSVQRRLHDAVFEVVQGKPDADPLTYEKELPLDLLPFTERTSKYRAVGTAFAIEQNRFVTAAHVVAAGIGSQYGPLALRDANGTIYMVDEVTKYSAAEDYAEFTVRDGPRVKPLNTDTRPSLNEPVFAVGNALGEGIVIRDGLYTSDTPEERSGRWKWLRFSAAASPGNSGGPLIDRKGRVIGVILRKSPNENLNSAVAITQVQHGSHESAGIDSRVTYGFPPMLATEPAEIDEHFTLPKPIADFYMAAAAAHDTAMERIRTRYLTNHAEQIFPHGDASELLLNQLYVAPFPRAIMQRNDATWGVNESSPQKAQLEHNGFVESAAVKNFLYLRLRAPDDLAPASLYGDSKVFMDMLLKALMVRRPVGSDMVRVISLGSAHEDAAYKDEYGRSWQVRGWRVPFNDSVILTVALPTPQGYVVIARGCPSGLQVQTTQSLESLTAFTYVSLQGTLKQWQSYLTQSPRPDLFQSLDIRFEYGKSFEFRSKRLALSVSNSVQKIDPASVLVLKTTYFRDSGSVVWDVGGLYLADPEQRGNWIDVLRRHRPPENLPDNIAERWRAIETGAHPYTAVAYSTNGGTQIETIANARKIASKDSDTAYTVTITREGSVDQAAMKAKLDAATSGIAVLEH